MWAPTRGAGLRTWVGRVGLELVSLGFGLVSTVPSLLSGEAAVLR